MTDFASDLLWEEGKDPEKPPLLPQDQPMTDTEKPAVADPLPAPPAIAAAGNAALAQTLKKTVEPTKPTPRDKPQPKAAPKTDHLEKEQPEQATKPAPEPPAPTASDTTDQKRIRAVLLHQSMQQLAAERPLVSLDPLLQAFQPADKPESGAAAQMLVSAFLALPAGARKPARDQIITALKNHADVLLAQLLLIRLAGTPVVAPPPPPPPPAPPGG